MGTQHQRSEGGGLQLAKLLHRDDPVVSQEQGGEAGHVHPAESLHTLDSVVVDDEVGQLREADVLDVPDDVLPSVGACVALGLPRLRMLTCHSLMRGHARCNFRFQRP